MYDSVAYDPVKTKQLQSTEFNNMIGLFFRSFLLLRQSVFTRYGVTSGIGVLLPNPFDFHEIVTLQLLIATPATIVSLVKTSLESRDFAAFYL